MGSILGKRSTDGQRSHNRSFIFDWLPSWFQPHHHIVMLGLDSSGKTTILYRLKFNQYLDAAPTIGFNCEKVKMGDGPLKGENFDIWDLGGQDKIRPLWRSYTRCTDGIVFVVDSVDEDRMEEAKMELQRTLRQSDHGTPLLVLANKQDLPRAKDPSEVARLLGLPDLPTSQPWHVEGTCAVIGDGLEEGLQKLHEMILVRRSHGWGSRKSLFKSPTTKRLTQSV